MVEAGPLIGLLTVPGAEVTGEWWICHHCLHNLCPSVVFPSGVLYADWIPSHLNLCLGERNMAVLGRNHSYHLPWGNPRDGRQGQLPVVSPGLWHQSQH